MRIAHLPVTGSGQRPGRRQQRRQPALDNLARLIVSIPDPEESPQAAARFTHQDLPAYSLSELRQEEGRLHLYWLLHASPPAWIVERRRMVALELLARADEP
jgi:hypothetical protein